MLLPWSLYFFSQRCAAITNSFGACPCSDEWHLPASHCLTHQETDCRGQITVTLEGPLCAILWGPAFLLLLVFCAGFQPLWICASLLNVDSWVLASWPQLCPSSNLLPTTQLGPLDVMLWLGPNHCLFPVGPVLGLAAPLEPVWLKEVVPCSWDCYMTPTPFSHSTVNPRFLSSLSPIIHQNMKTQLLIQKCHTLVYFDYTF